MPKGIKVRPYDWEQEDALGHGAEPISRNVTQERDRSDMGISPYKHPLYLDYTRRQPATEERIEGMVRDGFKEIKEFLDGR